jgi:hypothetical protein
MVLEMFGVDRCRQQGIVREHRRRYSRHRQHDFRLRQMWTREQIVGDSKRDSTKKSVRKRWKGITACLCLSVLALLWYAALTTLNEIILLAR